MSVIYRLILVLLSRVLLIVALMPAACFVKAGTAKLLGDDTPQCNGRLSLDFRRHMDKWGMLITLVLGFGWSREMNYDVSKMKHMKLDIILISLAGPASYFLMYVLLYNFAGWLYGLAPASFLLASLYRVLTRAGFSALCFGAVALLPIPPLDGFQIFYQFSWPKFRRWYFSHYQQIMRWSQIILLAVFFLDDIADGELSIIGPIIVMWQRILGHLIFLFVDYSQIPDKIIRVVFG